MGRTCQEKSWLKRSLTCTLLLIWLPFLYAEPPNVHIPRTPNSPNLSDFESMQPSVRIREHVVKVTGFIAREPADGAEPTQNTDVYLAYDQHNLYAVFVWSGGPGF